MTAEEVNARRAAGNDSQKSIKASPDLLDAIGAIGSGLFSPDEPGRYRELVDALTHHDTFMVCGDFDSYAEKQSQVAAKWRDRHAWWQASVLNTARMGWFSSDRTIREYCDDIWNIKLDGP